MSPDLTPVNFFLWEKIKCLVYERRNPPENREEIVDRVHVVFSFVKLQPAIIRSTVCSMIHRACMYFEEQERQFKNLL